MIKKLLMLMLYIESSHIIAMVPTPPKPHIINKTMAAALLERNKTMFPEDTVVYEKQTNSTGYYHEHTLNFFYKTLRNARQSRIEQFNKNIEQKQVVYCPAGYAQKEAVIIHNTSDCSECDTLREYLVWYNNLVD